MLALMAEAGIRRLLFIVQKRCLGTSAASITAPASTSSFTVEYLINSCGLSPKSALSASKKLQLNERNRHRHELVLHFLKAYDFTDAHIAKLIQKRPQILLSRVEGNLRFKFDYFVNNGFVGRQLPEFFLLEPHMAARSLDAHIKPCFELLRLLLRSREKVVATIRRCPWLLSSGHYYSNLRANVDLLLGEGVPVVGLEKCLTSHPKALVQNRQKTAYALTAVKNLGLEPKAPMFAYAVRVMMQMSESTWKKKTEVFKSVGWSDEDISSMFKRFPFVMNGSAERIRSAIDFFMNTVMFNKQDIIANPVLLKLSMDRRVLPRWNLIRILMSNNLVSKDVSMKRMLTISEELFLQNYVCRYVYQLPDIMKIYQGSSNKAISSEPVLEQTR